MARRTRQLNKNIAAGGGAPPGLDRGGLAAPMHGTVARGRGRTTARSTTTGPGMANKQFLSAPRQNVQIGETPITAHELTNYVNTVCNTELHSPGFIAANPSWLYDLGVTMFGGGANI